MSIDEEISRIMDEEEWPHMSVRKRGKTWVVVSKTGKALGTHSTKKAAEAQLRAIESNKRRK